MALGILAIQSRFLAKNRFDHKKGSGSEVSPRNSQIKQFFG